MSFKHIYVYTLQKFNMEAGSETTGVLTWHMYRRATLGNAQGSLPPEGGVSAVFSTSDSKE